jgi:DNA-binding MurR/RpiR family transcriptional regulator
MAILDRVQSLAGQLTGAERRLVQEVVSKPRDVALGTAAELAKRSGVHEATASRLARKLGFETYAGFRKALREEFIPLADPAVRARNTLEESRGGDLLAGLVTREIEALSALPVLVTAERLAAAARAIAAARKIYVFAAGNAETLAVMMNRRLRRLALDVELLRGDGRDVAEQMVGLGKSDALLAFAFRRQPKLYAPLLEHARAAGAASVVIAGSIGPALAPAADHLLSAPRSGERDSFQTLTVPMAICNALVIAIMQNDEAGALSRLERLGTLIQTFERR